MRVRSGARRRRRNCAGLTLASSRYSVYGVSLTGCSSRCGRISAPTAIRKGALIVSQSWPSTWPRGTATAAAISRELIALADLVAAHPGRVCAHDPPARTCSPRSSTTTYVRPSATFIEDAYRRAVAATLGEQRVLQHDTGRCVLCSHGCTQCGHPVRCRNVTLCRRLPAQGPAGGGPAALLTMRAPGVSAGRHRLARHVLPAPPAETPCPGLRGMRAGQTA